MRNYSFNNTMEWHDFQNLACEIVQIRDQIHLQMYKEGTDAGKDGLWFDETSTIVVQVKRYKEFHSLYQNLKSQELKKVQKLNPDRYILVISLELSQSEVGKIFTLFKGYIKTSEDLLTAKTLNSLLSKPEYHFIEKAYTKLWLPNPEIIPEMVEEIVNKYQRNRNLNAHRDALNAGRTFVQTQTYQRALEMLDLNRTILISGEPGMGKTTLAYILALEFLAVNEYAGFVWADSIEDIETQWEYTGQRQVFILDDFWGDVFYRESGRKASRKLENLIYRVMDDGEKRLIITSREYIVQQEILRSPELESLFEQLKLECVLEEYSDGEKAKILFSHLKESDLEIEYINAIYYQCDRIVKHCGYSPRIIGKFLKQNDSEQYSPYDYVEELCLYLEYPENFWKEIFSELSEESQVVLYIIAVSYTPIRADDVRKTYGRYLQNYIKEKPPKSFEACIAELEKTFIKTYWDEESVEIMLGFDNPSIVDFIYSYLDEKQEYYIPRLCESCVFYNQLLTLLEHFPCKDNEINQRVEKRCVEEFYHMQMRLFDYGDPYLGEKDDWDEEAGSDWAGRAFHLMKCAASKNRRMVQEFIREFVSHFYDNQDQNPSFNGVDEMVDFVGLLETCEKNGMHFDGRTMMDGYWSRCFLEKEYTSFKNFQNIYPEAFAQKEMEYRLFMKKNIKKIILESLEFYEEEELYFDMDSLVDEIPYIIKEYGLRYTEKYKMLIQEIAGRYFNPAKSDRGFKNESYGQMKRTEEEEAYELVKEEAYEELLGGTEEWLEEEECISVAEELHFEEKIEKELFKIIISGEPWYIDEMLRTRRNLSVLKKLTVKYQLSNIPQNLDVFMNVFLFAICEEDQDIFRRLIEFCAVYTAELFGKEIPSITEKKLKTTSAYETCIADSPKAEEVLFQYLLVRGGKWIEISSPVLMIYCFCRILINGEENPYEGIFQKRKMPVMIRWNKDGGKSSYMFDYNPRRNLMWEERAVKIFQELDRLRFYQCYVIPKLTGFLHDVNESEDRVMGLLKYSSLAIDITGDCEVCGGSESVSDELELISYLGIAGDLLDEVCEALGRKAIKYLSGNQDICQKDKKETSVMLYKADISVIKECGVYQSLDEFLSKVEALVRNWK